jgi:LytS/YehU family sensor histidine kinase
VRHGVAARLAGGTVELRAERRDGTLALEVRDDGVGAAAFAEGVGLANTRARLAHLYGVEHRFAVTTSAGTGFSVAIEIVALTAYVTAGTLAESVVRHRQMSREQPFIARTNPA